MAGQVSLQAAGDLGQRRAKRLGRHMLNCTSCRELAADLSAQRSWSAALGGLESMASASFLSVRQSVRARINSQEAPRVAGSFMRPMWPVLAPLAGVLVMGAVLVLGGGRSAGPAVTATAKAVPDTTTIHLSTLDDAAEAMLSIQNGPGADHRVAVSSLDPSFTNARVFRVQGDRWVDPTPVPAPGQVIFYRVD